MTANTKTHFKSSPTALIGEYDEEATEWLEDGGRANIERIVAEWRAAIEEGHWVERLEDVLVLRALRHEEHWVTVLGGPNTEVLIRELVDEDWRARGVETATRIGEVFAHELLRGDTGEPFRVHRVRLARARERGPRRGRRAAVERGNSALGNRDPSRGVPRRGALRRAPPPVRRPPGKKSATRKPRWTRGDESGWTPVADGPVFPLYPGSARGRGGADDSAGPSPSHALHRRARMRPWPLGCARRGGAPRPAGERASKAVESARVSGRWRVAPGEPIFVRRIRYDLDEWSDLPVPAGYRIDPFRDSG